MLMSMDAVFALLIAGGLVLAQRREDGGENTWRPRSLRGGRSRGTDLRTLNQRQLEAGTLVELEHVRARGRPSADDLAVARTIAADHLVEYPDYYVRLRRMEREAGLAQRKRKTA